MAEWTLGSGFNKGGLAEQYALPAFSDKRAAEYNFNKGSGTYTPKWHAPASAGGVGTDYYIPDSSGNLVGMNSEAANAYKAAGGTGLIDGSISKDLALGSPDVGFMGNAAGMLGGIAQIGQLGLGLANYGLQKDQFAFNKMNANRNYEAEKTKYNNAVDRTAAINDFYGSKNTATRIG